MSMFKKTSIISALFFIFACLGAGAQQQSASSVVKTEYSDKQVDAFAKAYLKVVQIQNKEQKNLAKDASQEEVDFFLKRMNIKLEKAIEGQEGMNLKLYNKIMSDLDKDPSLMKKVQTRVQSLRK